MHLLLGVQNAKGVRAENCASVKSQGKVGRLATVERYNDTVRAQNGVASSQNGPPLQANSREFVEGVAPNRAAPSWAVFQPLRKIPGQFAIF